MNKDKRGIVLVTLIFLSAVIVIVSTGIYATKLDAIEYKTQNIESIATILIAIVGISLIIERFCSVLIGGEENLRYKDLKHDEIQKKEKIRNLKDFGRSSGLDDEEISKGISDINNELVLLRDNLYEIETTREGNLRVSMIFVSCLLSLAGIHTLHHFVDPSTLSFSFQKYLFSALDVLLTIGVFAGGSMGISKLIDQINHILRDK